MTSCLSRRQGAGDPIPAPATPGRIKLAKKLTAQQESGAQRWDIDVAVVHQKAGGEQVAKRLLQKYRQDIQTGGMVSSPSAIQALGVNVDGYDDADMFLSQTAIAWNSDSGHHPADAV